MEISTHSFLANKAHSAAYCWRISKRRIDSISGVSPQLINFSKYSPLLTPVKSFPTAVQWINA